MNKVYHIGITGPIYLPSLIGILDEYRIEWPKGMGGVPVNHLIISLINLGHKVSVYSSSTEISDGNSFEYHQNNLSIYLGPYRKRPRDFIKDLYSKERQYLQSIIQLTKPDFIHAHWQYEWAWAALDSGVPTLVTCHDAPFQVLRAQTDLYRIFRVLVAKIVLNKASHLTTVSPYCAKSLKRFTKKKISIIPNFEPNYVFNLFDENKTRGATIKIAMINSGFTKLKNVERGIEAFCLFRKFNPESELHLFGNEYEKTGLASKWCQRHNINTIGIHFHGEKLFENLMELLSKMDVLLHTSLEESFGMVLVEAMAMGIPVIAGEKSGGPEWIIKDGGGFLVDINSINSIFCGLKKLCDKNIYLEHSKIARSVSLEKFSENVVLKMYIDEYNKLIKFYSKDENHSYPS